MYKFLVQNVWKSMGSGSLLGHPELLLLRQLHWWHTKLLQDRVIWQTLVIPTGLSELIGASHLSSEGHCCLLIQCHDELAQIKPDTQQWTMSFRLCGCMAVHVHFSGSASLLLLVTKCSLGLNEWPRRAKEGKEEDWTDGKRESRVCVQREVRWEARMLIHYVPQLPRGRLQQHWFRAIRFGLHLP